MCYTEEIWKEVPGYENKYHVSNMGRVKTVDRTVKVNRGGYRFHEGKILKLTPCKRKGYIRIAAFIKGKQKPTSVHRMVATAFIPNPENKPQVNHINGIKTDNRVENLEWATQAENNQHAWNTGLNQVRSGSDNHMACAIDQLSLSGELVKRWGCMADVGREYNVRPQRLWAVVKRRVPVYDGFKWVRADAATTHHKTPQSHVL